MRSCGRNCPFCCKILSMTSILDRRSNRAIMEPVAKTSVNSKGFKTVFHVLIKQFCWRVSNSFFLWPCIFRLASVNQRDRNLLLVRSSTGRWGSSLFDRSTRVKRGQSNNVSGMPTIKTEVCLYLSVGCDWYTALWGALTDQSHAVFGEYNCNRHWAPAIGQA